MTTTMTTECVKNMFRWGIKLNFNGGVENMDKTTLKFITVIKNGEVKHIGKSIIRQPEVKFGGGSIKWFDDKQLVKQRTIV